MNALLTFCLDEKINQLQLKALILIHELIALQKNKAEFKFESLDRVLSYLLDRLIEPKLAAKSEGFYFNMLTSTQFDFNTIVVHILGKSSFYNPQLRSSHRLFSKKLLLMAKVVQ